MKRRRRRSRITSSQFGTDVRSGDPPLLTPHIGMPSKSDNGVANLARTCPLMHMGPVRVCENGRVKVGYAACVSVFAHELFALPWVVDSPPPHLNGFNGGCERGAEVLALGKAKSGNKQDERNSQATQTLSESTGKQEPASPEIAAASSQLPRGNPGRSFFFLWVCRPLGVPSPLLRISLCPRLFRQNKTGTRVKPRTSFGESMIASACIEGDCVWLRPKPPSNAGRAVFLLVCPCYFLSNKTSSLLPYVWQE